MLRSAITEPLSTSGECDAPAPGVGVDSAGPPLELTKYLGVLDVDGSTVLFNQLRFAPVRVAEGNGAATELIDRLRAQGAAGLPKGASDFLAAHGILESPGSAMSAPDEWTEEEWRSVWAGLPFVFRVPTHLLQPKLVVRRIQTTLDHLKREHPSSEGPRLRVKYLWDRRSASSDRPLLALAQLMPTFMAAQEGGAGTGVPP